MCVCVCVSYVLVHGNVGGGTTEHDEEHQGTVKGHVLHLLFGLFSVIWGGQMLKNGRLLAGLNFMEILDLASDH